MFFLNKHDSLSVIFIISTPITNEIKFVFPPVFHFFFDFVDEKNKKTFFFHSFTFSNDWKNGEAESRQVEAIILKNIIL